MKRTFRVHSQNSAFFGERNVEIKTFGDSTAIYHNFSEQNACVVLSEQMFATTKAERLFIHIKQMAVFGQPIPTLLHIFFQKLD